MINLQKRGYELANEYANQTKGNSELVRYNDFVNGLEAAIKELQPMIQKLAEGLKSNKSSTWADEPTGRAKALGGLADQYTRIRGVDEMNKLIEEYKKAVVKKYSDRASALGDASPTYEDGIEAGFNSATKYYMKSIKRLVMSIEGLGDEVFSENVKKQLKRDLEGKK